MTKSVDAAGRTRDLVRLENLLMEELDRYRDLLDVLLEQKALLTAHQVERLPELLERQQRAIEAAKALEPERMVRLRAVAEGLGVTDGPTLRAVIERLDSSDRERLTTIRESLLHIVPRVDQVNRINSLLIRNSMSFISTTVRAILEEASPASATYERRGQASTPDGESSLTDRRA